MKDEEDEAEYTVDGPLLRVSPYYFTYITNCKLRWQNRKLLDLFSTEFRLYSKEQYTEALENGHVTLNGVPATLDSVIRNGDCMCHRVHRHEPPVSSRPIKVVHQDDDLVIIDKPSGIPAHPTGRYRHNSVTLLLERQLGGIKVHPCNRLDRLTSGLMILAKSGKSAQKMVEQMRDREIHKQYIAKVIGEFPLGETDEEKESGIVVEQPLTTIDPRLSFNIVDKENGKPSKTVFKRLNYDGETSLVLCKPLTRRPTKLEFIYST
ncbi:unnamed protein product [Ambrosiozyma monospora]|uniref:Pseudouridine synthase n=1 Tax=Ambrosiozyma monospora TaxID=43982 RepID=A0A9W6T4M7_AMBMO|nr:unnamed protein product [Ambrosiozyma monospora]